MGSFLLTGKLSSHWEVSFSLMKFLFTGKLPTHWIAFFSLESFPVTEKLSSRWEASFSLETSILLGRSLPTGKFPYRWEVGCFFTGMLTTTKLLTMFIFKSKLHSLYHLLGKDKLFTWTSSCLWLFGFTTKIFWKSWIFRKFPGKSKKFPGTLEYPEYPLLKGKHGTRVLPRPSP